MSALRSTLLWLPTDALSGEDDFTYWAQMVTSANGVMQDFNNGALTLEEAIEDCLLLNVDVDNVLENLDLELNYLGY